MLGCVTDPFEGSGGRRARVVAFGARGINRRCGCGRRLRRDEAFSVTNNGTTSVTVRSGDLVVRVEGDAPPDTTLLSTDVLANVGKAVLGKV
jgi:hypothetical protein